MYRYRPGGAWYLGNRRTSHRVGGLQEVESVMLPCPARCTDRASVAQYVISTRASADSQILVFSALLCSTLECVGSHGGPVTRSAEQRMTQGGGSRGTRAGLGVASAVSAQRLCECFSENRGLPGMDSICGAPSDDFSRIFA